MKPVPRCPECRTDNVTFTGYVFHRYKGVKQLMARYHCWTCKKNRLYEYPHGRQTGGYNYVEVPIRK